MEAEKERTIKLMITHLIKECTIRRNRIEKTTARWAVVS